MKKLTTRSQSFLKIIFIVVFSFISLESHPQENAMPPTLVEAVTVTLQPWQKEIAATGTLVANPGIIVRSEIDGRITRVFFRPGDPIIAGTPLIETNPTVLKADVDQANAQLKLSEHDYKRAEDLYKRRVLSAADRDKALTTFYANKANAAKAQALLDQTLIRAPFNGRIGLNLVNLGDYITAGQDLVSLQATDPIRVDFSIPEIYIPSIAVGQTVLVRTSTYPTQPFTGQVFAIDAAINPSTRSLALRASVPNKDQKLIPGAFVEVALLVGNRQSLPTIPIQAIINTPEGQYVYKIVANRAVKTVVKTGENRNSQTSILSGLKPGDIVIVAGQIKIQDGAPVTTKTHTTHK